MTDTRSEIELDVGAAFVCAEGAASITNELVGLVLLTTVPAKEAATALHHAYSAQYCVARAFDLSKLKFIDLDDCLSWMRKAHDHAEQLRRCFPTVDTVDGRLVPYTPEWAARWPREYEEAKNRSQDALEKIVAAIRTVTRQQQIVELGKARTQ